MKRILNAIQELMGNVIKQSPLVFIVCTIAAIVNGFLSPFNVWINSKIIELGALVASNQMSFISYLPYLFILCISCLAPSILNTVFSVYITPTCEILIRTIYKGKMLKKLKRIKYEHMENVESLEIIQKAYTRSEEAAIHLFPNYYYRFFASVCTIVGMFYLFCSVRWWFLFTILVPFLLDTYVKAKDNFNIYNEMETYWNQEHQYGILGNILRSRDYLYESHTLQSSSFLISAYEKRLHNRNVEFEKFYWLNLKKHFAGHNLIKLAQIINAFLLLFLYLNGELEISKLIALSLAVFSSLWSGLDQFGSIIKWLGHHIKAYEYYDKFFELSEEEYGVLDKLPEHMSIEFRNVCFSYPKSSKKILNNVSFVIEPGEIVSLVGGNGEGKTTIIKLLLGLFHPDSGEILIGGIPICAYSQDAREKLFSVVFQDFSKFELTLNENVGVGNVSEIEDLKAIQQAIHKAKIDQFLSTLPDNGNSLLGRSFDGGVDVSGGQWQRIAIGRAFMGERPILILDEPTSQVDPMTESEIYSDFSKVALGRTTLLVTHRLGATTIANKILVLSNGTIIESGSHDELIKKKGLYSKMFLSQQQWYTS